MAISTLPIRSAIYEVGGASSDHAEVVEVFFPGGTLWVRVRIPLITGPDAILAHVTHLNVAYKLTANTDPNPFAAVVDAAGAIAVADDHTSTAASDSNAGNVLEFNTEFVPLATVGQRVWVIAWCDDLP